MVLFSDMLSVFLTAVFICLIVQSFAWNVLGLTRRVLGIFRVNMDIDASGR